MLTGRRKITRENAPAYSIIDGASKKFIQISKRMFEFKNATIGRHYYGFYYNYVVHGGPNPGANVLKLFTVVIKECA